MPWPAITQQPKLKRTLFHRIARFFGIVFLCSSALCFALSIGFGIYKTVFAWSAVRTHGEVINLSSRIDSDGDELFAPIFQFQANDGQSYIITSTVASKPSGFQPGDSVEVIYRVGNPKDAEINTPIQKFLFSFVLAAVGFIHGIIGACGFYYAKRRDKKLLTQQSLPGDLLPG
jgi:hypothetical protein